MTMSSFSGWRKGAGWTDLPREKSATCRPRQLPSINALAEFELPSVAAPNEASGRDTMPVGRTADCPAAALLAKARWAGQG